MKAAVLTPPVATWTENRNAGLRTEVPAAAPQAKTNKRIRLLLADDHPVVRKGIMSCLERNAGMEVVGEAGDGREALGKARELAPDILLTDIDMPQMNGLALTETLHKEMPQIKVMILSMHASKDSVLRIIASGARGYVLKEATPEELVRAIETVDSGEAFFSPEVARVALNQFVQKTSDEPAGGHLTNREQQVLVHIVEGLYNKEIGAVLGIGTRTVETHRERIMRKLKIHSVAGLTKYAIAQGMISVPTPAAA